MLLAIGANVNAVDEEGCTALHILALNHSKSDLGIAQLLVDSGAFIETKNRRNMTALQVAAEIGNDKVVKILVGLGADVNARSTTWSKK